MRRPWHSDPRRPVRLPSTRFAFERLGIPGLTRPAGQPLAHIAAQRASLASRNRSCSFSAELGHERGQVAAVYLGR
jgi:hypothetical protein